MLTDLQCHNHFQAKEFNIISRLNLARVVVRFVLLPLLFRALVQNGPCDKVFDLSRALRAVRTSFDAEGTRTTP